MLTFMQWPGVLLPNSHQQGFLSNDKFQSPYPHDWQ